MNQEQKETLLNYCQKNPHNFLEVEGNQIVVKWYPVLENGYRIEIHVKFGAHTKIGPPEIRSINSAFMLIGYAHDTLDDENDYQENIETCVELQEGDCTFLIELAETKKKLHTDSIVRMIKNPEQFDMNSPCRCSESQTEGAW